MGQRVTVIRSPTIHITVSTAVTVRDIHSESDVDTLKRYQMVLKKDLEV